MSNAASAARDNVLAHLRPGGRIVIFGAKTTQRLPGAVLNPLLERTLRGFSFATTPLPSAEPWWLAAQVARDLEIVEYFFGTMFLASATFAREVRGDV